MWELPEQPNVVYDLTTANGHFAAGVGRLVVHNTDSIFVMFPEVTERGREAIMPSIRRAQAASTAFKKTIRPPHDLEYEKTFWPWIILSKKRYVGNVYEFDDEHFKQKSMGIVLKRRDNAPIVKKIYGGCIEILLRERRVAPALAFLAQELSELAAGRAPLEELVITKTLRAEYKNPDQIAHQVLARRMGERDPGNKPQVNDRVPYIFICPPSAPGKGKAGGGSTLQGDRIEHPDYIRERKLPVDYRFYVTNQIMKPVLQLFALALEEIPGSSRTAAAWARERKSLLEELVAVGQAQEEAKVRSEDKMQALREAEVKALLFDGMLHRIDNANNQRSKAAFVGRWFAATP